MSRTAFLTDSTLCIGCKACEVACKEWNGVGEDGLEWSGFSYDNTGALGHSTWRHVKFVENTPEPGFGGNAPELNSWAFSSDVCKHCENAGCLEACPTGAIVRTEFGGVYVQPDICNGCAYCVIACPFGVVERNQDDGRAFKCTFCYDRQKVGLVPACAKACPTGAIVRTEFGGLYVQPDICNGCAYCVIACPFGVVQRNPDDGRAFKCTFCYDRQKAGLVPACAKACPTESIKFGEIESLRVKAQNRMEELHQRGMKDATFYDASNTSVGGTHAMFIVRGDPRSYNLPPKPEVPTIYLKKGWTSSAIGAALLLGGTLLAFLADGER